MKTLQKIIIASMIITVLATAVMADEIKTDKKTDKKENFYSVVANFEMGFLAVADHKIQFGTAGTMINYVTEGGQDVLFPVMRLSLDLILAQNHRISFLYQPLELKTENILRRPMSIDGVNFALNDTVEFLYSFPFYRISYAYDIIKGDKHTVAFGASLQIRNATINFRNLTDTTKFVSTRDIGPVPVLKFYWKTKFDSGWFIGAEIDGFYAPISYLNGSDTEIVGAIVDASLRGGVALSDRAELFLNVRYLGGGAIGTSKDNIAPSDGYVNNWLHFITVTAGFTFRLI